MKHSFLYALSCLLALVLGACDEHGSKTGGASPTGHPGSSKRGPQSGADRRAPSGASTGRDQAPPDYGSKLTADVSDLEGLISDLNARVTDREIIVDLPADVLFDFDKADIRSEAVTTLEKLARLIKQSGQSGGVVIQVNGHTDSIGADAYNTTLSERRAASVVQWLTTNAGIAPGRLQAKGYGESRPVAQNTNPDGSDNPEGRQKNRRVEVIIPRK
jgi:outer membrane protein OmpA-like peptidoglycan-associated protein